MTIAISLSRILEHVYAHSALTIAENPELERPPLLGERQDAPLRVLAYHALCRVVTDLHPIATMITRVDEPSEAEIICIDAQVSGAETLGATLRIYIEDAICTQILRSIWPQRAEDYSTLSSSITNAVKTLKANCNYKIRRG